MSCHLCAWQHNFQKLRAAANLVLEALGRWQGKTPCVLGVFHDNHCRVMPSGVVIYVYIHHSLSLPRSYSLFCVLLAMYISPFPIVSERTPLCTLFVVFLQTPQLYFSRPFFTSLCLLLQYPHAIKMGCEYTPLPLSSPLTSCYLLRPALFSSKYTSTYVYIYIHMLIFIHDI